MMAAYSSCSYSIVYPKYTSFTQASILKQQEAHPLASHLRARQLPAPPTFGDLRLVAASASAEGMHDISDKVDIGMIQGCLQKFGAYAGLQHRDLQPGQYGLLGHVRGLLGLKVDY